MPDYTEEQLREGRKQAAKEREAEWEAVKKRFPIPPNATQQQLKEITTKRNAAMLDP